MWAQYAENSSGICFVFDKPKFLECLKNSTQFQYCFEKDIIYRSMLPDFTNKTFDIKNIYNEYKDLFFYKHKDWRDEDEYRVVVLSETDQFFVKIPCDSNCFIKGIVMGLRFQYVAELIFRLAESGLLGKISLYNSTSKYDGVSVVYWSERLAKDYIMKHLQ